MGHVHGSLKVELGPISKAKYDKIFVIEQPTAPSLVKMKFSINVGKSFYEGKQERRGELIHGGGLEEVEVLKMGYAAVITSSFP